MAAMRPIFCAVVLCILVQLLASVVDSFTYMAGAMNFQSHRYSQKSSILRASLSEGGEAKVPKYVELSQDALLAAAIVQGKKDAVKMLLDSGAPLEAIASKGRTVINDAESARLLLEAGAHLEALDDTGRTPLALAAAYGNLDVLRVYVEFGANLEAQDNGQLTALLWAAVNGNEDVVRFLVANGANTEAKDEDGMTALSLATVLKRSNVQRILAEAVPGKRTA